MFKSFWIWILIILFFSIHHGRLKHTDRDEEDEFHDRVGRRGRKIRRRDDYYDDYEYYEDDNEDLYYDDYEEDYSYRKERRNRPRRRNRDRRRKGGRRSTEDDDFEEARRDRHPRKRRRRRKRRERRDDDDDEYVYEKDIDGAGRRPIKGGDHDKFLRRGVKDWLGKLKLEEYIHAFQDTGFDDLNLLAMLNEEEREDLYGMVGVVKLGHKLKLRRALDALSETNIKKDLY